MTPSGHNRDQFDARDPFQTSWRSEYTQRKPSQISGEIPDSLRQARVDHTRAGLPSRLEQTTEGTNMSTIRNIWFGVLASFAALTVASTPAAAQQPQRPNIIMIMGDDIGWFNIGAYHQGTMASRTPNLDKLASEGMRFTDYYAEASCTAGRANFITGELSGGSPGPLSRTVMAALSTTTSISAAMPASSQASSAQQCGPFATYRPVSCRSALTICRCITACSCGP